MVIIQTTIVLRFTAYYLSWPLLVLWLLPAQGQRDHLSVLIGYGAQEIEFVTLSLSYDYRVAFYQLQYERTMVRGKVLSLGAVVQPQYTRSNYLPDRASTSRLTGFEWGLSTGLLLHLRLWPSRLSCYGGGSIGPHYISARHYRQATGFLFSNNVFGGLRLRIGPSVWLDLRSGIRHLSNAGLRDPNRGLNTLMVSGGVGIGW